MNLKVKFLYKQIVARETEEFFFEKPENFTFYSGQYLVWKLNNDLHHDFTLSSSPFEKHLSFATRMRSSEFKSELSKLKPNDLVEINGPHGNLILPNNSKTIVMIAGGIGITPFRSMVTDLVHNKIQNKTVLFFADKTTADMAFLQELKDYSKDNPQFQLIPTLTKSEEETTPWTGETGHLTKGVLAKFLGNDLNTNVFMCAGPPAMVDDIRSLLLVEIGIPPENLIAENFGGY